VATKYFFAVLKEHYQMIYFYINRSANICVHH